MAHGRNTLMDPPIESLLDKVDSKFTLVALGSTRARQVNAYYNSLGEGLGKVVPPQVTSLSGKPLSIAFEEVAAGKATFSRPDPEAEAAALALAEAKGEIGAAEAAAAGGAFGEDPALVVGSAADVPDADLPDADGPDADLVTDADRPAVTDSAVTDLASGDLASGDLASGDLSGVDQPGAEAAEPETPAAG